MYIIFFRLLEAPFSLVPSSKFNYFSKRHVEALNCLLSSVQESSGLALLTGEVGTGKTTTMRVLLERMPDNCRVAILNNPSVSVLGFMQSICDGFSIPYSETDNYEKLFRNIVSSMKDNFEKNISSVLLVDEAHILRDDVLEQLFLLSNVDINEQALLKVILIGQPELLVNMQRTDLRHLAQRITSRVHLSNFNVEETGKYIIHRLNCAGRTTPLFDKSAVKLIAKNSNGVPRMINLICEQSLKIAYNEGHSTVKRSTVKKACQQLVEWRDPNLDNTLVSHYVSYGLIGGAMLAGIVALALGVNYFVHLSEQPPSNVTSSSPVVKLPPSVEPFPVLNEDTSLVQGLQVIEEPNAFDVHDVSSTVGSPTFTNTDDTFAHVLSMEEQLYEEENEEALQVKKSLLPSRVIDEENIDLLTGLLLNESDAFTLLKDWWVDYKVEANRCSDLFNQTPTCSKTELDLVQLIKLNYPAILELALPDGSKGYGLFYAADNNSVKLLFDNMRFVMSGSFLEKIWTGKTQLFWLPPDINREKIVFGGKNESIAWLDEKLKAHFNDNYSVISNEFDATLKMKVRSFQRKNGLAADGIPGPLTLMMLTALSEESQQPILRSVDDSPWENWLLEDRGLIESFDIISSKKLAGSKMKEEGLVDEYAYKDNQIVSPRESSPLEELPSVEADTEKKPNWLEELEDQGFVQLGAVAKNTKTPRPSTSPEQTIAKNEPSYVENTPPSTQLIDKVITEKTTVNKEGDPVELRREITVSNRSDAMSGLRDSVGLEEIDVSKLPPELAKKVMLALEKKKKQVSNSHYVETVSVDNVEPGDQIKSDTYLQNGDEVRVELLSSEALKRLPAMNFQAHIYSSDFDRRWVRVNGDVYKEGENISQNVRLKRIEPNQVVVEFEDSAIIIPALWSYSY